MIDLENWDPTDSNEASKAAELANRLEGVLLEIMACLEAKDQLDRGFKGMGYNILQEKAGMLNHNLRLAKKIIERGPY